MPLTSLTCPICLSTLKPAQPVEEGSRVRCPKCKGSFVAEGEPRADEPAPQAVEEPAPKEAEEPPEEEAVEPAEEVTQEPPRKNRRTRADEEEEDRPVRGRKARAREEEDDEDHEEDRPRKKRKKQGVPVWVWFAGGGVGLLLLCGCCGVPGGMWAYNTLLAPRVTMANYLKVQRGMTEPQVIAVLGQPTQRQTLLGTPTDTWMNGDDLIIVFFDANGRAFNRTCRITDGPMTTTASGF